jgi:hypothetical protein
MDPSFSTKQRSSFKALAGKHLVNRWAAAALASATDGSVLELEPIVQKVLRLAAADGTLLYHWDTRRRVWAFFRQLERLGFGRYVLGRYGRATRFLATRDIRALAAGTATSTLVSASGATEIKLEVIVRLAPGEAERLARLLRGATV